MGDRANLQLKCPGCSRKFVRQARMATYSDVEAASEELHSRVWQHCSQKHMHLTWNDIKDLRVSCYSLDWAELLPCPMSLRGPPAPQRASQITPHSPSRCSAQSSPRRSPRRSPQHSPSPRRGRSRSRRRRQAAAAHAQLMARLESIHVEVVRAKQRLKSIERDVASLLLDANLLGPRSHSSGGGRR